MALSGYGSSGLWERRLGQLLVCGVMTDARVHVVRMGTRERKTECNRWRSKLLDPRTAKSEAVTCPECQVAAALEGLARYDRATAYGEE